MKRRLRIILPILFLALGAALLWRLLAPGRFLYAGTIEATEIDLSSRVTSVIERYQVVEGETVPAGATLVTLTCEDLRLTAGLARRDYERAARLRASGSMPQEAFERARYQMEETALKVDWCTITAPSTGTVLETYQEAGERVVPGTRLLTLGDLREVWAYVYVPQPLLARLRLGMTVKGYLPEIDRWLEGRIRHIRSEAEFTPKNVQTRHERTRLVFGVKVAFPNPEGLLKPGMTIEVQLPQ